VNKGVLTGFFCFCLLTISLPGLAQTDSIATYSKTYERIVCNSDWAIGKLRGFKLGDSLTTILHSEKAILEAQGDDFLYYRVLCDSTLSAEISYTFDEKGFLISIGIEFFESCKNNFPRLLSDEFLMDLQSNYRNCIDVEMNSFECKSETGVHVEYQKLKNEMCLIHTQIEFY
jgi:hypothetical protein